MVREFRTGPRGVAGVGVFFISNGAVFAALLPWYPLMMERLGLSAWEFGLIVASFAIGAIASSVLPSRLIARFRAVPVAVGGTIVLAAAVALASRGEEAELAELARRAWSAAAGLRTIPLNGAQADADAVAHAVASALRPSDELLTVITGRNAGRDVGALAASAAVGARGQVLGEDVEVAVHAGGQERPDVLIAIE